LLGPRYSVERELKSWFSGAGRVVVAGVGNPIRMDDFVGVRIVQGLRGRVSEKVSLIECETVPENHMKQIIDFGPSHVLLIDAALLGLKPGEGRLIMPERITDFAAVSTHMLPLRIFCEYVAETTRAKIGLLLIEPGRADFGEGLTSEVETSARRITGILLKVLP
jgi:hydrogenase 3 maturation protease